MPQLRNYAKRTRKADTSAANVIGGLSRAILGFRTDIILPSGGLGTRLDAMYAFHARHGIKPQRGHGKHDENGSVIRWCFADAALAEAFTRKFGQL
jgi:hypothetical protein